MRTSAIIALALAASWLVAGCTTFDPPPEVELPLPEAGIYTVGEPLTLTFSEPIVASTLAVRVWRATPEELTLEDEFVDGLTPLQPECKAGATCAEATLVLADDRMSAVLTPTGEAFTKVKVPFRLEVLAGLEDDAGRRSKAATFFDFQFAPGGESTEEITFTDGVYLLTALITYPVKVPLTMYAEIRVHSDGDFRLLGAKGKNKEGTAKNTADPAEIGLDVTGNGFGVFVLGTVSANDGEVFLQTVPQDLKFEFSGLPVSLDQLRFNGTVVKNPETGQDRIEGTISYSGITIPGVTTPPGNTSFVADLFADEFKPQGLPSMCGDLCGEITSQCNPPEDYPGDGWCE